MAKVTKKASAAQAAKPGAWEQVEGFCTNMASSTNMPMLKSWMNAYFHPAEAFASEKKNASWGNIVVQVILITIITTVAGGLAGLISLATAPNVLGSAIGLPVLGMGLVAGAAAGFIGVFLVSLLYLIVAKLFKGAGSYTAQTLGLVLVSGGTTLLLAPLQVLGAIPCLGVVFSLAGLVFGLYGIYSQYRMLKAVHNLSQTGAIGVMVISWVVIIVIVAVVILIAGAALLGAMGLGAIANSMGSY